jgi:hypothetical protein
MSPSFPRVHFCFVVFARTFRLHNKVDGEICSFSSNLIPEVHCAAISVERMSSVDLHIQVMALILEA